MANHDELVAEMPHLEQMGTQERQKLAKKRRMQQLKKWSQREKDWLVKEKQLNKRLANILNEENNGLNLKQYTTYNSNQRAKKKPANNRYNATGNNLTDVTRTDPATIVSANGQKEQKLLGHNNNNNYHQLNNNNNNNNINSLLPNGRVHFNVGVMLLEAAARNDFDEVKRLLSLGVSPDSVNHDGLTALHQCCIDASEPMMDLLLEFGANVDARDTEQWTPLHAACTCGHLNLVKILVEHGADLLAVNGDGNMPFDICEDESTLDYIESQMVARGITQEMIDLTRASNEMQMLQDLERLAAEDKCDLNFADANGVTQLHIAAANNYLSVVKFLLKQGVNPNVCDTDQWRPLHGVACWGNEQHIKVIELLVEAGASLDARTSNDESVFDLCDNIELLERLNQLKDELESKQATGTGRLKRTQSKTNSRVHSVRRTSVRDKNQISRREAREEALLRVESSESLENGHRQLKANVSDSSETPSTNETSPARNNGTVRAQHHANGTDQVDSLGPIETDLDHEVAVQDHSQRASMGQVKTSKPNLVEQSNGLKAEQTNQRSQREESQHTEGATSNGHAPPPAPHTTNGVASDVHVDSAPRDNAARAGRISSAPQLVNGKQVVAVATAAAGHAPNRQAPDLNGRLPAQSTTIVQVHFAPMNYTLSNLKKHRSDLRMRSASSGGIEFTHLKAVNQQQQQQQHEMLVGDSAQQGPGSFVSTSEIASAPSNGGLVASGSPEVPATSTFRKFHGEPSDVIEFKEGRRRPGCCSII